MAGASAQQPLFEVKERDARIYAEQLAPFLPERLFDIHTHIWLDAFMVHDPMPTRPRGPTWPRRVARENPIEDLLATYALMFPGKQVTPMLFGYPDPDVLLAQTNDYVSQVARTHRLPALLVSTPTWSAAELAQRVTAGGFLGLKPYLSFAPAHIPASEITIYDFLPPAHLEVADAHGWIVMLHIPRPQRLRDRLNLQHLVEIEQRYPNVTVIVAHIGRAYCQEDVGDALDVLAATERLLFDFSANTNAWVMTQALRALGPRRLLFGSDLPILRMRMRRICENGRYVNLVPPGLYGDVSDDPNMREVSAEEGERLTFFMYEELLAFRRAAETVGLTSDEVADVMYGNAARLIARASAGHRGG